MDPQFCANGCGFYGSSETRNFCSKCYKDHILKHTRNITESSVKNITESISSLSLFDDKDTTANATSEIKNSEKKSNRCKSCNKKVGLTGFHCRCGDLFCGKHRYPEEHSCTVDFKQLGRQILIKQNPLIKADKLDKIL